MSFNKDLIYICKHVEGWPYECYSVRLDSDGEICFNRDIYDFFPEGRCSGSHPNFIKYFTLYTGQEYTKEEFLACKEFLYRQGNPSVAELQDVVSEKVKSRIKEIRKRHTEDYKREITPLLEVLQRRGVNCDEFIEF